MKKQPDRYFKIWVKIVIFMLIVQLTTGIMWGWFGFGIWYLLTPVVVGTPLNLIMLGLCLKYD